MELFLDGAHLRLRSREEGTYLHADEDGWGVSRSPHRASLNTAWVVHLLHHIGSTCLLLHGAAYGRYLAFGNQPEPQAAPPQGHHLAALRTIQRVYDTPLQGDVMWELRPAGDGSNDVRLRHVMRHAFVMSLWVVEAIPLREFPPDLPQQIPNGVGRHPVMSRRLIRYVGVDDSGIFNLPWRSFILDGRSVVDLMGELGAILNVSFNNITLCVRAGFHGRLTPLVIDLPDSEETMDVVIFTTGSPAALELRHPDVDAE